MILVFLILLARASLNLPVSELYQWVETFRQSPYIISIVILTFIVGSFLALPQWALFVAVMTVFTPVIGVPLAWVATLISASVNFSVGRWIGRKRLSRFVKANGGIDRLLQRLKKDGFMASFIIRFIPTGPFIFVNMFAGASGLKFFSFFLGTALGVLPKITIVALLTQGLISNTDRIGVTIFSMLAAISLVMVTLWLRHRYSGNE
ncbi:MAG: VTT domain-containing protein [Maricaulaceae bacterium]